MQFKIRFRYILPFLTALSLCLSAVTEGAAAPLPEPQSKSTSKKKRTSSGSQTGRSSGTTSKAKQSSGGKGTSAKGTSKSKTSGSKGSASPKKKGTTTFKGKTTSKPETSADVKKRQEETRREIQRTQEELKRNEAEMKKSLGDLGRINADLEKARGEVSTLQSAVGGLDKQIGNLNTQITENEAKLAQLREEYLKAVKKMRHAKGHSSTLAFIFSADNFNQAMRRMRYLRQFSVWKDKQSAEINNKVAVLTEQKKKLALARQQKDVALQRQKVAEAELAAKGKEQDAVVADLKRNGDLLAVHLSKKQQEANALKNRISALIAEEERKAAAEREAARKREEERLAAERRAAEKRAAEQAAAAKAAAEQAAREQELAQANAAKEEKARKEAQAATPKKEVQTTTPAKKETKPAPKKETQSQPKDNGKSYADARKRRPRGQQDAGAPKADAPKKEVASSSGKTTPTVPAKERVADNGFASMKGSLPRPVDGLWRVTSRFGRQELPDLPGVIYDNPGINVEVAIGATVKSVYAGKVSGVYMVPGYQTVIIINHGDYYTAYGNLKGPAVKVGDTVKAGQKLGITAENQDDTGHGELHFEVYKNREKLNPLNWIR